MNLRTTPEWKKRLLTGDVKAKDRYYIRLSFRPAGELVRVVLELVRFRDGLVASTVESPPIGVNETLSMTDLNSAFTVTIA